jgi:hypothetical protein
LSQLLNNNDAWDAPEKSTTSPNADFLDLLKLQDASKISVSVLGKQFMNEIGIQQGNLAQA